jgi:PST family polysaccharide transporter
LTEKQKIVSAAAWSVGAGLLGRAIGLACTLWVARYLSPDIVGEVAVATVIAFTGNWVSAWGCGQYVIVHGHEGKQAIFPASMVYLVFGAIMLVILWSSATMLAGLVSAPRVAEYLPGALLGVAIRRIGAIPDKLLARELRFGRIALATGLGDLAYAFVAIVLVSTTGLGGHAMIVAYVVQSCVITLIQITGTGMRSWLAPVPITWQRIKAILRFGAPITAEITLSEGARYWDKPLMLRLLGAEAAGTYNLAFNLAHLPALYVGGHVGTVMMPAIVRADPQDRAGMIVRALALTAVVLFPMAFGLAACASTLVAAVLPPDWAQVAPLLSVMATLSVLGAASFMLASFLAALGQNAILMRIEFVSVVVLLGALVFLSRWGIVVASFAVGLALAMQFTLSVLACRRHGLVLHALGKPVMQVMLACVAMVAGILLLRVVLQPWLGELPLVLLLCETGIGAVLYLGTLWIVGKELLHDVARLLGLSGRLGYERAVPAQPRDDMHD